MNTQYFQAKHLRRRSHRQGGKLFLDEDTSCKYPHRGIAAKPHESEGLPTLEMEPPFIGQVESSNNSPFRSYSTVSLQGMWHH